MDKLDYLILHELLEDAQVSFLTIAKKLGVSSFTVKNRYDKMTEEKIIFKSSVTIDLSKLGYQGKAFLLITNRHETPKSVTMNELKRITNIIVVNEIIGPFDIIAIAPIIDLNSLRTLVDEVRQLPSVERVHITCVGDTMFPIDQTFSKVLSEQSYNLAMKKT
jgi:Lrp/AsnC family transcriptional regulator for asnA, asnC and gidA